MEVPLCLLCPADVGPSRLWPGHEEELWIERFRVLENEPLFDNILLLFSILLVILAPFLNRLPCMRSCAEATRRRRRERYWTAFRGSVHATNLMRMHILPKWAMAQEEKRVSYLSYQSCRRMMKPVQLSGLVPEDQIDTCKKELAKIVPPAGFQSPDCAPQQLINACAHTRAELVTLAYHRREG